MPIPTMLSQQSIQGGGTANSAASGQKNDFNLTSTEIQNSRFYGASFARMGQMMGLSSEASNQGDKETASATMSNTVDNLNKRIGIDGKMFNVEPTAPTLGKMRNRLNQSILKEPSGQLGEEAIAWREWLHEPSRITALMMPEMNNEAFLKSTKLDKNMREEGAPVDTTEPEDNEKTIDTEKKRVIIGDKKRKDSMSHLINSGETEEVNGEQYPVYWVQESYANDVEREGKAINADKHYQQNAYTWTPKLKQIHNGILSDEHYAASGVQEFEKEARKKYFFKKEEKARDFTEHVMDSTQSWIYNTAQNRFFRLTSLMGLDFFKNRGNTVLFARDQNQANYTEGRVNRAITDSEWAHTNRMGYNQAGGHVFRVNNKDKFHFQQTGQ